MFLASTCSNYGVTSGYADEATLLSPQGLYAETKVEAERAVSEVYFHVILRFATLFGVSPRMRLDLMLNEWTADMLGDGVVEVYQPEAHRPILCVLDAARTITGILKSMQLHQCQTYNVGVDEFNYTKRDIAETIRRELGGKITYVDRGDPRDYEVSFAKLDAVQPILDPVTPRTGVKLVSQYLYEAPDTSRCYNYGGYR